MWKSEDGATMTAAAVAAIRSAMMAELPAAASRYAAYSRPSHYWRPLADVGRRMGMADDDARSLAIEIADSSAGKRTAARAAVSYSLIWY